MKDRSSSLLALALSYDSLKKEIKRKMFEGTVIKGGFREDEAKKDLSSQQAKKRAKSKVAKCSRKKNRKH